MSGSNLLRASLPPPPSVPCSGLHDWVLLDPYAYIAHLQNGTTATTLTAKGHTIVVSLVVADPPRRSYFCVSCPELRDTDVTVGTTIVCSVEDLALLSVQLTEFGRPEFFIYRARGGPSGRPSLDLLKDIGRYFETDLPQVLGLVVPHGDGGSKHFAVAALGWTGKQHCLHVFRPSERGTAAWTEEQLVVDAPSGLAKNQSVTLNPHKVIALGGGVLGWVDLHKGILICDVLAAGAKPRVARFVPMPKLLLNNRRHYDSSSGGFRDVTFDDGLIKCVELEQLVTLRPRTVPVDPLDMDVLPDSEAAMDPPEDDDEYDVVGWRLVTWYRAISWAYWRKGSMVHSDDLGTASLPPQPGDGTGAGVKAVTLPFKDLKTASPTLHAGDVVYLVAMLEEDGQDAWMVTLDTKRNSVVRELMPLSGERSFLFGPTYISCELTKYLNSQSGEAQVGRQIATIQPVRQIWNYYSNSSGKRQRLSQPEEELMLRHLTQTAPVPQLMQSSSVKMPPFRSEQQAAFV